MRYSADGNAREKKAPKNFYIRVQPSISVSNDIRDELP